MEIPAYYRGYKVPDEYKMDGGNSLLFLGWCRGVDTVLLEGRDGSSCNLSSNNH